MKRKYEEALAVDGVVGLVIGTRPDCMPDDLLRYLEISTSILSFWWNTVLRVLATRHSAALTAGILFKLPSMRWSVRLPCGILTGGHVILDDWRSTHGSTVHARTVAYVYMTT